MQQWSPVDRQDADTTGLETLRKADAIIGVLEHGGEASAKEVSTALGLSSSSTYRLLRALKAVGFVDEGSRRGLFRIGAYFLAVGRAVEDGLDIRRYARDILQQLCFETGWTWSLYVSRGHQAICLERFEGLRIRTSRIRVGDSFPLHSAAGPRAILAFLPDAERHTAVHELYAKGFDGIPGMHAQPAPPPRQVLEEQIGTDRARGFAIAEEVITAGSAGIGVPIWNYRGELEGAVVVGYWRDALLGRGSQALELAKRAANSISSALGYRGSNS